MMSPRTPDLPRPATPARVPPGAVVAFLCTTLALFASAAPTAWAAEAPIDAKLLEEMKFRNIGPYRGGRVTAVAGHADHPGTYYMGSTGGGVWRTHDAGITWSPVSDKDFKAASIGAIAVAPSDHNVVWAGTGSACVRGNVSPGVGIYRSTDAGESWTHAGLKDAGQIARIRVHPDDPDTAWVAVLGHAFGPSRDRGVFRTTDGGKTWKKVLGESDRAGAIDLAIDPANPRVLYAATWKVERKPWTLDAGGEGSALWRSKDGGETWDRLVEGLPKPPLGRIGVTVSGADSKRVWALVEAEDGGLYRSDDGGRTFRLVSDDRNFLQRAWYYTHVFADPVDVNTVWILNVGLWRSDDGGKSFQYVRAPHGDHHDLWINPRDPKILINGNDGGANVSYNGGRSWSTQANQPTAEMYRVSVDARFPYHVYGCQQDNSCVAVPSRTPDSGITQHHWYVIGGCESGHVAIDPRNPDITYSGCYGGTISRFDRATGQDREIMAWPQLAVGQAPKDLRYRFQWNAPIRISPHEPGVVYHTSQFVHRTTDEGQSWSILSPDLTRNARDRQDYAGGPITRDNTGVEVYGSIFAFEESPHQKGLFWAGSDDGLVHLSRDGGATWNEITPKRMPEWGQVNSLELSAHGAGRAFLAVTRYKFDDFRPWIFRTDDFGRTWDLIADGRNGIPADHFVRVVREDPDRKGLIYAGTEFGLYVSFDDGGRWLPLQGNLPVTPITDLAVTRKDLVIATQGRSFWILDDLTPLHEMSASIARADAHLFAPRDTVRFAGGASHRGGPAGANPPTGVILHYTLAKDPAEGEEVLLEILNADGEVVRRLSSLVDEPRAPNPFERYLPPDAVTPKRIPAKKGLNRWVWDFRHHDAAIVEDAVIWGSLRGPRVPPGTYRARLTAGGVSSTRPFEITIDPRLNVTRQDLIDQYRLARAIWESLTESHRAVVQARDIRDQIAALVRRLEGAGRGDGLGEPAGAIRAKLTGLEEAIRQTKAESSQDILNYTPRLDNQLVALKGVVESADARPTDASYERFEELRAQLDRHLDDLRGVIRADLVAFNEQVRGRDVAPVIAVPPDAPAAGSRTARDAGSNP